MHFAPAAAHNIATSKMTAILPASAKRTNKGRFCRAQVFIRNNNAEDRLTASWFDIEKQEKGKKNMCVIPKSAVAFHFAAVNLWN